MIYRMLLNLMLLSVICLQTAAGQSISSHTISSLRGRQYGMGGAAIAMADDIPALINNPAALETYDRLENYHFTLYLNPVLPVYAQSNPEVTGLSGKNGFSKSVLNFAYLFKGATFSSEIFDIGVVLFEEAIIENESSSLFHSDNFKNTYFHSFGGRIRLAKRVSFGGTFSLYSKPGDTGKIKGGGTSYGILISPNKKISIGVVYFDMTKGFISIRQRLDGYRDESVNAGISLHYKKKTNIAVDVKGLNTESKQQYQVGVESAVLDHFAVRVGYILAPREQEYDKVRNIFTIGAGLINQNKFRSFKNRFMHKEYLIDYSFVVEDVIDRYINWHFLTLKIRL